MELPLSSRLVYVVITSGLMVYSVKAFPTTSAPEICNAEQVIIEDEPRGQHDQIEADREEQGW
jgi:hypothetical protein